jgi:hypothetical protein
MALETLFEWLEYIWYVGGSLDDDVASGITMSDMTNVYSHNDTILLKVKITLKF